MAGKIVNKLLASRVREARESAELSQSELADAASIGQTTIAEIEAGRIRRPKKLRELALALKVSEGWLLGEADDKTPVPELFPTHGVDLVDAPLEDRLQPGMFRPLPLEDAAPYALNTMVPRETRIPGKLTSHFAKGNDQSGLGIYDGDLVIAADFATSREPLDEPMLVIVGRTIDGMSVETSVRQVVRKKGQLFLSLGAGTVFPDIALAAPVDKQGRSKDQQGYAIRIWGIAVRLIREIPISKN